MRLWIGLRLGRNDTSCSAPYLRNAPWGNIKSNRSARRNFCYLFSEINYITNVIRADVFIYSYWSLRLYLTNNVARLKYILAGTIRQN